MVETSFYIDLDWNDPSSNNFFEQKLDHYFNKYVAGRETSKSGTKHYQVWTCASTPQAYDNFIALMKKRFKLQGRATKNNRKQYGRIQGVIRDTDNMISYCLKEKNYIYKGLSEDYIKAREEYSFVKEDTRDTFERFLEEMSDILKIPPVINNKFEAYQDRLTNATLISEKWYKHYKTIIPRTTIPKVLYLLGLTSHEDIAKQNMSHYIGIDPHF